MSTNDNIDGLNILTTQLQGLLEKSNLAAGKYQELDELISFTEVNYNIVKLNERFSKVYERLNAILLSLNTTDAYINSIETIKKTGADVKAAQDNLLDILVSFDTDLDEILIDIENITSNVSVSDRSYITTISPDNIRPYMGEECFNIGLIERNVSLELDNESLIRSFRFKNGVKFNILTDNRLTIGDDDNINGLDIIDVVREWGIVNGFTDINILEAMVNNLGSKDITTTKLSDITVPGSDLIKLIGIVGNRKVTGFLLCILNTDINKWVLKPVTYCLDLMDKDVNVIYPYIDYKNVSVLSPIVPIDVMIVDTDGTLHMSSKDTIGLVGCKDLIYVGKWDNSDGIRHIIIADGNIVWADINNDRDIIYFKSRKLPQLGTDEVIIGAVAGSDWFGIVYNKRVDLYTSNLDLKDPEFICSCNIPDSGITKDNYNYFEPLFVKSGRLTIYSFKPNDGSDSISVLIPVSINIPANMVDVKTVKDQRFFDNTDTVEYNPGVITTIEDDGIGDQNNVITVLSESSEGFDSYMVDVKTGETVSVVNGNEELDGVKVVDSVKETLVIDYETTPTGSDIHIINETGTGDLKKVETVVASVFDGRYEPQLINTANKLPRTGTTSDIFTTPPKMDKLTLSDGTVIDIFLTNHGYLNMGCGFVADGGNVPCNYNLINAIDIETNNIHATDFQFIKNDSSDFIYLTADGKIYKVTENGITKTLVNIPTKASVIEIYKGGYYLVAGSNGSNVYQVWDITGKCLIDMVSGTTPVNVVKSFEGVEPSELSFVHKDLVSDVWGYISVNIKGKTTIYTDRIVNTPTISSAATNGKYVTIVSGVYNSSTPVRYIFVCKVDDLPNSDGVKSCRLTIKNGTDIKGCDLIPFTYFDFNLDFINIIIGFVKYPINLNDLVYTKDVKVYTDIDSISQSNYWFKNINTSVSYTNGVYRAVIGSDNRIRFSLTIVDTGGSEYIGIINYNPRSYYSKLEMVNNITPYFTIGGLIGGNVFKVPDKALLIKSNDELSEFSIIPYSYKAVVPFVIDVYGFIRTVNGMENIRIDLETTNFSFNCDYSELVFRIDDKVTRIWYDEDTDSVNSTTDTLPVGFKNFKFAEGTCNTKRIFYHYNYADNIIKVVDSTTNDIKYMDGGTSAIVFNISKGDTIHSDGICVCSRWYDDNGARIKVLGITGFEYNDVKLAILNDLIHGVLNRGNVKPVNNYTRKCKLTATPYGFAIGNYSINNCHEECKPTINIYTLYINSDLLIRVDDCAGGETKLVTGFYKPLEIRSESTDIRLINSIKNAVFHNFNGLIAVTVDGLTKVLSPISDYKGATGVGILYKSNERIINKGSFSLYNTEDIKSSVSGDIFHIDIDNESDIIGIYAKEEWIGGVSCILHDINLIEGCKDNGLAISSVEDIYVDNSKRTKIVVNLIYTDTIGIMNYAAILVDLKSDKRVNLLFKDTVPTTLGNTVTANSKGYVGFTTTNNDLVTYDYCNNVLKHVGLGIEGELVAYNQKMADSILVIVAVFKYNNVARAHVIRYNTDTRKATSNMVELDKDSKSYMYIKQYLSYSDICINVMDSFINNGDTCIAVQFLLLSDAYLFILRNGTVISSYVGEIETPTNSTIITTYGCNMRNGSGLVFILTYSKDNEYVTRVAKITEKLGSEYNYMLRVSDIKGLRNDIREISRSGDSDTRNMLMLDGCIAAFKTPSFNIYKSNNSSLSFKTPSVTCSIDKNSKLDTSVLKSDLKDRINNIDNIAYADMVSVSDLVNASKDNPNIISTTLTNIDDIVLMSREGLNKSSYELFIVSKESYFSNDPIDSSFTTIEPSLEDIEYYGTNTLKVWVSNSIDFDTFLVKIGGLTNLISLVISIGR